MAALSTKPTKITPRPQSSKPRIREASQSTTKSSKVLPSKPRGPEASQSATKSSKVLPPKTSHSDRVKSKPKPQGLKPELPWNPSTPASSLSSPSTAKALRRQFLRNLALLTGPPVKLINDIDDSSPPVSFNFINSSIIGEGVETVDEGFMSGCNCRPENGRNCGCEYRYCSCLTLSAKDEKGNHHFPYSASTQQRGTLRPFYLNSRHHIYECNKNCNCRDNCKNKVVQHGRQVPLEIFKTVNRGWGKPGYAVGFSNAN